MSAPPRASRRRSREAALQVLYAVDVAQRDRPEPTAQEMFESASAHFELPEGARAFAKELVLGVVAQREELDARIARHAAHWRVERMTAVDRNVLRLAAFELGTSGTPTPVVIDEAVELARRFGGERSPAFVNGVLDALAREEPAT
jgi:N utilization substance protein B